MERVSARRPLPALIFLLGLSLLTALVWWRVIHRSDSGHHHTASQASCPNTTTSTVPQPGAVNLTVLNSTDRNHLARTVGETMTKLGFHVARVDNDSSGVVNGVAEIRYGPKGSQGATLLSFYLPGATLVPVQQSDSGVTVSLGTKFTAVATTAAAKAAMQRQHVTQLPAKPGALARTPTAAASSANC